MFGGAGPATGMGFPRALAGPATGIGSARTRAEAKERVQIYEQYDSSVDFDRDPSACLFAPKAPSSLRKGPRNTIHGDTAAPVAPSGYGSWQPAFVSGDSFTSLVMRQQFDGHFPMDDALAQVYSHLCIICTMFLCGVFICLLLLYLFLTNSFFTLTRN